ncbi:BrnT family toxin [uncultured Paludibaculum sp.]|uniref:BrnT family toxin n=1 Tax=uncultured Paludibaculum sp. TaxID=1765020 RepID=UPI002AAB9B7B|nr:BrnT family toxin [uncultured Paludibaculum sp.]
MAKAKDPLATCTGFEWDDGNTAKNWERHQVATEEAEDVFFNEPLVVRSDARHSGAEKRYYALGQTSAGRRLFASFTIRRSLLRVISVRDMNRKERDIYAKHEKETGA